MQLLASEACYVCRVNGNLNLSRAIGDLKYKGNDKLAPAEQIITAQPDIVKVCCIAIQSSCPSLLPYKTCERSPAWRCSEPIAANMPASACAG